MARLLHVFWDTDMRVRHEGLADIAKKGGRPLSKVGAGDLICFINRKRDRVMVLAGLEEVDSYGVLGYYRSPHGRVDEMAIQYIPEAFGARGLDMNSAIKKSLLERLGKKRAEMN